MKLKVYNKDGSSRELGPIRSMTLEFDRNTFHLDYRAGNGTMTHEDGELHTLFPGDEQPMFMFDLALGNKGDEVKLGAVSGSKKKEVKMESGVGHMVDPTTVSTAGLTDKPTGEGQDDPRTAVNEAATDFEGKDNKARASEDDLKKTQSGKKSSEDDLKRIQDRLREINEKQDKPKEEPKSFSVPVASAVGNLVDPGSQDTGKLNKEGNLEIPNPGMNKQGTSKLEINK